ncbi:unnamed protein product [Prunus armeniaca]
MVGSKHIKSKITATTQLATGPSQHDDTTLNQLLYSSVEATTPHPATLAPSQFLRKLLLPLLAPWLRALL